MWKSKGKLLTLILEKKTKVWNGQIFGCLYFVVGIIINVLNLRCSRHFCKFPSTVVSGLRCAGVGVSYIIGQRKEILGGRSKTFLRIQSLQVSPPHTWGIWNLWRWELVPLATTGQAAVYLSDQWSLKCHNRTPWQLTFNSKDVPCNFEKMRQKSSWGCT